MDQPHRASASGHFLTMPPGRIALVALAVLSIIEFAVAFAVKTGNILPLVAIALVKTGYIANTFMHVTQLFHSGEEAR